LELALLVLVSPWFEPCEPLDRRSGNGALTKAISEALHGSGSPALVAYVGNKPAEYCGVRVDLHHSSDCLLPGVIGRVIIELVPLVTDLSGKPDEGLGE
jgi:hypothetical protein